MAQIRIEGSEEFLANVRRLGAGILPKLAPAVAQQAAECLVAAQQDVPSETGELKASAFTDGPKISKSSAYATFGYTADYAGAEHEGFHGGRQTGAPPKWLEKAVDAHRDRFREAMSNAAKAALGSM